jgi:hypothetical protein
VFAERAQEASYEVVLVDAYERQIYLPAHVASLEFFSAVRALLAPGGVVAVNCGGRNFDDPVVMAVSRTMAAAFGEAHAFRVPLARNFVVLARRSAKLDPAVLQRVAPATVEVAAVLRECSAPGAWQRFAPAPPVLRDDRPFLDRLQERALGRDIGGARATPIAGTVDPAAAAARARQQLDEERAYEQVLATVASAAAATAELHRLAGDARWHLRDMPGALADYRAGHELALAAGSTAMPKADQLALLAGRIAAAEGELAAFGRADRTARRNGWLAGAAAALLGAALWLALRTAPRQ